MNKAILPSEDLQLTASALNSKFKITRSAIQEMYKSDETVRRNVNATNTVSSSLSGLTIDSFEQNYYSLNNLDLLRGYSQEAYAFYPIYSAIIDSLSNMFYWRYVFYLRPIKEKASSTDYKTIYPQVSEVVDGLAIETTFPNLLSRLFVDGSLFLITNRRTGSQTITTMVLPAKYCRITGITQFGTNSYQFDMSYFDNLGLTKEQLETIFTFYPPEMKTLYEQYKKDTNLRWQKLNPKFAAGFTLNDKAFPTYLRTLGAIMQYDKYRTNELERNEQQLVKIIAHKMPTWEDKLVVEVPEMTALHKSMSKVIAKNKYVRMLTTFGDLDVLSIGEDQTKENKTLDNAFAAIFNVDGENSDLYKGNSKEALEFSLRRKESVVWKHIQELVAFYNIVINNQYNFKGYQCSLNMLPLTVYNFSQNLLQLKEGATLGVSKLEYIVGLGTKQVDIPAKIELESFLKLESLTPLSTSYTGGQNASGVVAEPKEEPTSPEEPTPAPVEEDENTQTTEVQDE